MNPRVHYLTNAIWYLLFENNTIWNHLAVMGTQNSTIWGPRVQQIYNNYTTNTLNARFHYHLHEETLKRQQMYNKCITIVQQKP